MAELSPASVSLGKLSSSLYASSPAELVVAGTSRMSMLPPDVRTGNALVAVPAGMLPIGAYLMLWGTGTIGARLTTPPGFNFIPWVQPVGGAKTDLPGFAMAPLLGTDGTCEVWMKYTQTAGGIRTSGYVRYGTMNGMHYSIGINIGGTGLAGAIPTTVASDPNVDRTFGVDGFWGGGAGAAEYVKCRAVTIELVAAGA